MVLESWSSCDSEGSSGIQLIWGYKVQKAFILESIANLFSNETSDGQQDVCVDRHSWQSETNILYTYTNPNPTAKSLNMLISASLYERIILYSN